MTEPPTLVRIVALCPQYGRRARVLSRLESGYVEIQFLDFDRGFYIVHEHEIAPLTAHETHDEDPSLRPLLLIVLVFLVSLAAVALLHRYAVLLSLLPPFPRLTPDQLRRIHLRLSRVTRRLTFAYYSAPPSSLRARVLRILQILIMRFEYRVFLAAWHPRDQPRARGDA